MCPVRYLTILWSTVPITEDEVAHSCDLIRDVCLRCQSHGVPAGQSCNHMVEALMNYELNPLAVTVMTGMD